MPNMPQDNRGMNKPTVAAQPQPQPLSKSLSQPSAMALRLSYAGLIPFVAGALLVWAVREDVLAYVALALSAYAAVVLSFIGGIHWGLAMRQPQPASAALVWGVVPPLVAWPAAVMPPSGGLVILGLMLVVSYAVDRRLYPAQGAAAWLTLRFRLSAVAALSCFIAAAGT